MRLTCICFTNKLIRENSGFQWVSYSGRTSAEPGTGTAGLQLRGTRRRLCILQHSHRSEALVSLMWPFSSQVGQLKQLNVDFTTLFIAYRRPRQPALKTSFVNFRLSEGSTKVGWAAHLKDRMNAKPQMVICVHAACVIEWRNTTSVILLANENSIPSRCTDCNFLGQLQFPIFLQVWPCWY